MRSIGPLTTAALAAQIFQREILISVFDEGTTPAEHAIPSDAILGQPIVSFSLDNTSWEMTLEVLQNFTPSTVTSTLSSVSETSDLLIEGRRIVATEYLANGEPLALFTGKIMRVMPVKDWQGYDTENWRVDCVGVIAAEAEAHITRHEWSPFPFNPGVGEADNRARMTGIVKKYRNTTPYTYDATSTTTSGAASATSITVVSATGFVGGDIIYLLSGSKLYQTKITKTGVNIVTNVLTLESDQAINPTTDYPSGSTVLKAAGLIPIGNLPYFGNATLNDWVTVLNSTGTAMTKGTQFNVYWDRRTGAFYVRFLTTPGASYTVDAYAVDRWVILDRRKYNGTLVAPFYYILDGIQGQAGAERLNDQGLTAVRCDKTISATELWVTDPTGIFASDAVTDRWISVWIGGTEYRGKVSAVDKSGGADNGKVTLNASFPLRSYAGATALPTGGEPAGNTSSSHYEILYPSYRPQFYDGALGLAGYSFVGEPIGGWFQLFTRAGSGGAILNVIPGYSSTNLAASPGAWETTMSAANAVTAVSAGNYNPALNYTACDVAAALAEIMHYEMAFPWASLALANSGYTLAPNTTVQAKAGEVLTQICASTLPPNYRLHDTEDGLVIGGYIQQKTTPDLILRGGKTSTPNQKPIRATRVIVMGKQFEVNRAAQLLYGTPTGITDTQKLFDGPRNTVTGGAKITALPPASARIAFQIPASEPGRYPIVAKTSIAFGSLVNVGIGGAAGATGNPKYISFGSEPNDGENAFTKRELTDLSSIAFNYSTGATSGAWLLLFDLFDYNGGSYVDEIEVFLKEGAYWEAALTSDTTKAPADGATAGVFGRTWKQPDRTLSMSYRFAPPQHIKRNQCGGNDRTITIHQDGITQSQARQIAEANLDQAIRGFESYEWTGAYDPRAQPGDTVGIPQVDGSIVNRLVWAISKTESSMTLTLYDYSR